MRALINRKQYIVPVKFRDIEELGILNLKVEDNYLRVKGKEENIDGRKLCNMEEKKSEVSQEQLKIIEYNFKKQIKYRFLKMKNFTRHLTQEQISDIHINQFKDILIGHVDNIPCCVGIRENSTNGMNFEQGLEGHINKFKEIYNFHYNALKCADMNKIRASKASEEAIDMKTKEMEMETEAMFENMIKVSKKLSLEQILQMDKVMLTTIMEEHIENVPCFKEATSKPIDGMSIQEIINMHMMKFENLFNEHIEFLHCNK